MGETAMADTTTQAGASATGARGWRQNLRPALRNRLVLFGAGIIVLMVVLAALAGVVAPYDPTEIAFRVPRGAREVWEVRNSPISMPHPMHLHGFGFRVLRRQGTFGPARALATAGAGRLPTDLGVKDTVVVWPNETVQLAVDFSLPDDPAFRGAQRYMFHCHNLEHEDGMMMRNFEVA